MLAPLFVMVPLLLLYKFHTLRTMRSCLKSIIFFTIIFSLQSITAQQGNVIIDQDPAIPQLLEQRIKMSKNNDLGERFKIQLYYGNNQGASSKITSFRSSFDEWTSEVAYEEPNYKVWVGNFRNRLEADRALMRIKEKFPSAFIFKPERG